SAYVVANLYRFGHVEKATRLLGAVGNWPRMLRLVADELEGKTKQTGYAPTESGKNIMRAYATMPGAFSKAEPPTLAEFKSQWRTIFGKLRLPEDRNIRRLLTQLGWPLKPDKRGRPRSKFGAQKTAE